MADKQLQLTASQLQAMGAPKPASSSTYSGPAGLVNPGSVYQTYNPTTGQTTYSAPPSGLYSGTGAAVATPQDLPKGYGTPMVAGSNGAFVPLTQKTAFVETKPGVYEQNTSGLVNYKMPEVIVPNVPMPTKVTTTELEQAKGNLSQAMERNQQIQQTQAPQLKNVNIAKAIPSQIANPSFINALYREQYNRGASKEELAKFAGKTVKYASDIILGANKSPFFGTTRLPGAKPEVPETNQPAAPEIATPEGTIDPMKLMANVQETIKGINDLISSERAAFDTSTVELGAQLGTVAPLIQGEQAYQEQRKNVVLQRLVDQKTNAIEAGNLGLKVYEYAQKLRDDQKDAMAGVISNFLEAGVPISKTLSNQYAQLTGIDPKALEDGFAVAAKNYMEDKATKSAQQAFENKLALSKATAKDLPASYDEWELAGGLAGTKKTYLEWLQNKTGNDLSPAQLQNFMKISSDYTKDPLIVNGDKAASMDLIADQVLANPNSATNQLKALYTLVKGLDPESAVREGETALASQTVSFLDRFKTQIKSISEGQVIAPSAATALANAVKELSAAGKAAKDKRVKKYTAQANTAGVGQSFQEFLSGSGEMDSSTTTSGPAVKLKPLTKSYKDLTSLVKENPDYAEISKELLMTGLNEGEVINELIDRSVQGFNKVGSDTYKAASYLSNYGKVMSTEGSPYWKWGLDVDLKKGDAVFSPVDGEVVAAGVSGGFGNRVGIKTQKGNIVYLSHNDSLNVKKGDKVKAGQKVAVGGNTGRVISGKGGDGSHLDITVKKPDGTYYTPLEIKNNLS